ncbi:MAG: 7,8-dihydropterin-6-yl-methyl-4-(beta-D-ribofuranosyl)aminobenzene 5-phosphate synthase [Methanothermococcus sp.]|jgi:7,8-dihydropterin-6-yl-methyl-4-(beta-D-ribofuranosyl)aminobenzene 5'-phosphate synthase|uniref:MBL fold metallo-hydrolase n=1 Tax=Methanothermococcus TaxID=155862 RepID=UPI00037ADE01|nr:MULTISPECIES: MBL fold metallo-hydrolase [Methanothermococcus]MDK2790830.1 7,8-dihydropterin-6-yl-methyl-4-(beta-D-ribofuranosyl)aminobenzene 5-phosphate synthase [Methanothermococcus sp.]MDK2987905.1 7,8-dihydropterin-6-yl-methyl-4-(beta-D-ribofuranosyl)aminobenzene 5-phosphate synthase [Methanothermococcus sp.]
MEVKVIIDNLAWKKYFAQHGLSLIVKTEDLKILFDTGQNPLILKKNLEIMEEKDDFNAIVLSHGHYDHTDGFSYFIETNNYGNANINIDIPIIMHPDAFVDRYDRTKNKYIGIKNEIKDFLKKYPKIELIEKPYNISKNIIVSGCVKRNQYYETEEFYKLENGTFKNDIVNDDMFLIVDGVVITGCSHSGIINVIEYAKKIKKVDKIRGVIGGLHLVNSSDSYIKTVKEYLENQDLEFIIPLHCTGFKALKELSSLDNFIQGHVGSVFEF